MNKYLLKYNDAKDIAKKYNDKNFWETQFIIDGYKVSCFNYFLCGWNDFNNPLEIETDIHAFDMRGTTFVFNKDGSLWRRFFMLPKFFNVNQVEETQYSKIKDNKIVSITQKEDGSLISFMMLPSGKLFAKTIGSFASEQSELAYIILYKDEEHVNWVKSLLIDGYTPIFEYVGYNNRIVLKYNNSSIFFIGIRDNINGNYYAASELSRGFIPSSLNRVDDRISTLDELMEEAKKTTDKEGWVVKFDNGLMVKVKTQWYFNLHHIRTENIFREDYVIKNYLEETLDDLLSTLDPEVDQDAFEFVTNVTKAINNYIKHIDLNVYNLKDKFINEFRSDKKIFAIECHKEPFFGLSQTFIDRPEDYRRKLIELVLKRTSRFKNSKEIIEKWQDKK